MKKKPEKKKNSALPIIVKQTCVYRNNRRLCKLNHSPFIWFLTNQGWCYDVSQYLAEQVEGIHNTGIPPDRTRNFPIAKKTNKGLIQVAGFLRGTTMKFTVEASPEEWTSFMNKYILMPDQHDLNKDFEEFVSLADHRINPLLPRPAKETKSNYYFVRLLKVCSALISGLVQEWNSLPESEWPKTFKEIRSHIKKSREFNQEAEAIIKSHADIAAYCLEKLFGSDVLKRQGIKSFILSENAEIESFKRTYIEDGRKMLRLKKEYRYDYLEQDLIDFHVSILCYEKNAAYHKRDPEVLCFLRSISTAATSKDPESPGMDAEVKRIINDIYELFPVIKQAFCRG